MSVIADCPACDYSRPQPDHLAGRRVVCPRCKTEFRLPHLVEAVEPVEEIADVVAILDEPAPRTPPRKMTPARVERAAISKTPTAVVAKAAPLTAGKAIKRILRHLIVWPLRLLGLLMLAAAGYGFFLMWRLPTVAAENQVDSFDLALRAVEFHTEHAFDPMHLLGGSRRIQESMISISSAFNRAKRVQVKSLEPGKYETTIFLAGDKKKVLQSTTPHLTTPTRDFQEASRLVGTMFPTDDPETRGKVMAWGRGLMLLNWMRANEFTRGDPLFNDPMFGSADGTDLEQLWCVWTVLSAGQPAAELELPHLMKLFHAAYPNEAERRAAEQWAATLHRRLSERAAEVLRIRTNNLRNDDLVWFIGTHDVWLPPDHPTTRAWLVYQHLGLTESSRQAARERWLSFFPRGKVDRVKQWGRELAVERRAQGEPLPQANDDDLAVFCVVERLIGVDGYGERTRKALRSKWPDSSRAALAAAMIYGYPSDEFYYLSTSGDSLKLVHENTQSIGISIAMILLSAYGFRFFTLKVLAEWILQLRVNRRYLDYRNGGGHRSWRSLLVVFLVVPVIAWMAEMLTLPNEVNILVPTQLHLLAGVFVAVLMGGLIVTVITRLVAVLLIRIGVNVERSWLDEVIGILMGSLILYRFGNDAISIAAFALCEFLPAMFDRLRRKKDTEGAVAAA